MESVKNFLLEREDLNFLINQNNIEEIYVLIYRHIKDNSFELEKFEISDINMQVYLRDSFYDKNKLDSNVDTIQFENTHKIYVLKKETSTLTMPIGATVFNMLENHIVYLSKVQYYLEPLVKVHFA